MKIREKDMERKIRKFFQTSGKSFSSSKDLCDKWLEYMGKEEKNFGYPKMYIKKFQDNPIPYLEYCDFLLYKS